MSVLSPIRIPFRVLITCYLLTKSPDPPSNRKYPLRRRTGNSPSPQLGRRQAGQGVATSVLGRLYGRLGFRVQGLGFSPKPQRPKNLKKQNYHRNAQHVAQWNPSLVEPIQQASKPPPKPLNLNQNPFRFRNPKPRNSKPRIPHPKPLKHQNP